MKTITIIDTFGFLFKSFYALPGLTNHDDFPTGMLTGFINFITNIQKDYPSDYFLFAFDAKGKTFRHEIFDEYKANRKSPPNDLKLQLPIALSWVKQMGFNSVEITNYEADDIIASATKQARKLNLFVRILSHDKDLYQLIKDDEVLLVDPVVKKEINEFECLKKYGVKPNQIRDFLAICGDSADNFIGIKGIGPKGARALLKEYETLDNIYENISKISNTRIRNLLTNEKQSAILGLKLATLKDDLDVISSLEQLCYPKDPLLNIKDDLIKYNMVRALSKIEDKNEKQNYKYILLDDENELIKTIKNVKENIVAFDTETNSMNARVAKIVGFSFAFNENEAYYAPISHYYLGVGKQISKEKAKEAILLLFEKHIIGQNLKYDFKIVKNNFDINPPKTYSDTMILAWLLNPSSSVGLDFLAKKFFNHEMISFKQAVGKEKNFSFVDINIAKDYASEDALFTLKTYNKLLTLLDEELVVLANELEFSFLKILMKMENEGIMIDVSFFENLLKQNEEELNSIKSEIFRLANKDFNINSVQQLATILFEDLKLPTKKRTKTGYSTNEKVLNELINEHEIIPLILTYRELFKLKSTYIEPLIKLGLKELRVHTDFLQTGTSTGRLSSKNPNLQNIPVKTEVGRKIRQGFIAKKGYKLVSIDYSQIELRLLAHFSEDENLVQAFLQDKDIHLQTSLRLFGENEAKQKRNVAKSINFGLIYGMGQKKLADTLGIDTKVAKEYMQNYFALFPTLKQYFDKLKEQTKQQGYIQTLLKRKRLFDFKIATPMQYAAYERECVNSVFQGSAADIIKLAMQKIDNELIHEEAKLLLQIHDELIFEVKQDLCECFSKQASKMMEEIYKLKVPLKTSISIGQNWGELK